MDRDSIKFWSEDDRPREKLLNIGRRHLSDAEILAIIIGSGSVDESAVELSRRILKEFNNSISILSKATVMDLMRFKGIGQAKAVSIVAALELGRRRRDDSNKDDIVKISSSRDVFELMRPLLEDIQHEEFWVLLLNRANRVLDKVLLSKGGVSATVVDNKILFKAALSSTASGIILCHNHPSGNRMPSDADKGLTMKVKRAAEVLDISLLDHLIICDATFFSFADEGML